MDPPYPCLAEGAPDPLGEVFRQGLHRIILAPSVVISIDKVHKPQFESMTIYLALRVNKPFQNMLKFPGNLHASTTTPYATSRHRNLSNSHYFL